MTEHLAPPWRVVVADPIDPAGLELLHPRADVVFRDRADPSSLAMLLPTADGLLVRSETSVTDDLLASAPRLKVVGRAGAGVDNIDLAAATRRGVIVVNAPGGNTVAAAEHALALMLAAARRIPAADASLKRGEWRRGAFVGVEVRGKTLGLVGLGRVGAEVARRAQALEMRVLAFDPYVSVDHARRLGVELVDLEPLLRQADFLSLHSALTEQTRGIIGQDQLSLMKPDAILVNCARGGLVDETALLSALDHDHLAAAALDVFEHEPATDSPLARHPRVVATPHLGASTVEAQAVVARLVAEQVLQVLDGLPAQFAVNAPALPPEHADLLRPYVELAEVLGSLATQLADGQFRGVEVAVRGEVAEYDRGLLAMAVLRGLLARVSGDPVTFANARLLAARRGLEIAEHHSAEADPFTSLISASVGTERGQVRVDGTVVNGQPHIVGLDGFRLDLAPVRGHFLVTRHRDQPGIIGRVGTLLGQADINISSMQVGRRSPRGEAVMILALDEPVAPSVLAVLRAVPSVDTVRLIEL